jgi:hypothetical protein
MVPAVPSSRLNPYRNDITQFVAFQFYSTIRAAARFFEKMHRPSGNFLNAERDNQENLIMKNCRDLSFIEPGCSDIYS